MNRTRAFSLCAWVLNADKARNDNASAKPSAAEAPSFAT
jgi:hypothetical protein